MTNVHSTEWWWRSPFLKQYKTKGWGGGQGGKDREEKEIEQWNLKAHQSEPLSIRVGFAEQTMAVWRHIFSFPDPPPPPPLCYFQPSSSPLKSFFDSPQLPVSFNVKHGGRELVPRIVSSLLLQSTAASLWVTLGYWEKMSVLWSSSSEFNFMYHWWRIILIIWVRVESSHWTLFKPANLKNTDSLPCKRIVQVTTKQHSSLKQ